MWVPKFLYFVKYKKPPPEVQQISDGGDIYKLTVYFDRTDGQSRSFHKRNKGGFPQDYAVCIERNGTHVRILRRLISERITIVGRDGTFTIPNKHWGIGNMQFAHGREDFSPEEYLSRIFVEAALMYESSALGSMIRIEATKGRLAATFGVDVKRTSYFFKDRDVTLNKSGRRARIFHIVRPHIRKTRAGEIAVKLHFRGLRVFEWAGYKISITVPGLDHFILPELDVGIYDKASVRKDDKRRWMTSGALATRLADGMKLGLGGRK
jgi:hypothetical protein